MARGGIMRGHEPVFLNEGASKAEMELMKLEALASVVAEKDRDRLERDIQILKAGIAGERRVIFELSNSHYPLVFIHDLQLDFEKTSAQIDFLVVTPYNTIAIECKNLVGNIEIDSFGAFLRTFGKGRHRRREGIYSPVTQNERHVELLKAIARSGHGKLVQLAQHFFLDDYYHSVVVLANDKTILSAEDAPRAIRDSVIRVDQLVSYIRDLDASYAKKNGRESFSSVTRRAEKWLGRNSPTSSDVASRYEIVRVAKGQQPEQAAEIESASRSGAVPVTSASPNDETAPMCPLCGAPMVLRTARYGAHRGERFRGCSMYGKTRCKGIVNVGWALGNPLQTL